MPQCSKCGLQKEFQDFHREGGQVKKQCRECRKKYMASYYLNNKARILETVKKWQAAHPKPGRGTS